MKINVKPKYEFGEVVYTPEFSVEDSAGDIIGITKFRIADIKFQLVDVPDSNNVASGKLQILYSGFYTDNEVDNKHDYVTDVPESEVYYLDDILDRVREHYENLK